MAERSNNNPNQPPEGDLHAPDETNYSDYAAFGEEETQAFPPDPNLYPPTRPNYRDVPNNPDKTLPYNPPPGFSTNAVPTPPYQPNAYPTQPPLYTQPNQFSPEGTPGYRDYPPNPNAYPPTGTGPANIPPHRRPPGYHPYQPMSRNVPPVVPVPSQSYRQPTPPIEEYDTPPSYIPAPRRIAWGETPEPEPKRGLSWLIPLLIALILLLLISGAVIIFLLAGKNDNTKVTPATVPTAIITSQNTLAASATLTPLVASVAASAPANDATSPAMLADTPTLAVVGSALPPTSTPGAGAATQLAIFNATVTALANISPTPALTSDPATVTALAGLSSTPNTTATPDTSATPATSATPPVSATAGGDAEQLYQTGSQAVKQAQWQAAILAFEQLENLQPKYKDTEALLVQAYTEQGKSGVNDAQTAQDVQSNRQYFEKALALKPNDPAIKKLIQELDYYYNGRVQYDGSHWQQAINSLSPLFKLEPSYKDGVMLLYTAYLNQGDLLASQNRLSEALIDYRNAVALPVNDTSLAQQKIDQIQIQLTPTATAFPSPTAIPTPVPTATPVPTPTTALINGCPVGYFNFGPFVKNSTPPYNGPDQGKSSLHGIVVNVNNQRVPGAVVQIVSSNGSYSYTTTTDGDGGYSFSRLLGRGNWTVKLVSAPNIPICFSAAATVAISGQDGAQAEVSFVQTKP